MGRGSDVAGAKRESERVILARQETRNILHLSLRLKRATFIINILWVVAGEDEYWSPLDFHATG